MDDDQLIARAVQGDDDALGELLERVAPGVEAGIAPKIPDRFRPVLSAEDVLQQAFADAFLSIRRLEPRGMAAFAAWVGSMAECNLVDALRMLSADKRGGDRQRVGPGAAFSDASMMSLQEVLFADTATPSRQAGKHEAAAALRKAVEQLPEPQRKIVVLYDLECRAPSEVAAELGRSEGAMYMLRARRTDGWRRFWALRLSISREKSEPDDRIAMREAWPDRTLRLILLR